MARWIRSSIVALCTASTLLHSYPAWAAPGSLDLSFNANGKVATTPPDFHADFAEDVVLQADGKIVVVGMREIVEDEEGWTYTLVARYLDDGTPDPDFGGGDGIVTLPIAQPSTGFAVELLSDQRIAIGGYVRGGSDFAFAAFVLTSAGELDTSFDGDGVAVADFGTQRDVAFGLDVDASDRILLVGSSESTERMGLVRFTSTGAPDTAFSGDGKRLLLGAPAHAADVDVRPSGKIVVVGTGGDVTHFVVARFLANGTLDTTFSGDGIATTSKGAGASAVSVQADGKIVVAGRGFGTTGDFVVARFLPRGRLDASFHEDGVVRTDFDHGEDKAYDVEIQPNGKIVAVGLATVSGEERFGIVRYRTDGRRDLTFSGDGKAAQVRGLARGSALDGTPRLVVTGASSGAALTVRYLLL